MARARMVGPDQAVVGGTEGGRSPTGGPPTPAAAAGPGAGVPEAPAAAGAKPIPDPAVPEKPVRRRFTAEYKLRVLREAEGCKEPGQLGALLRREGLYSSHLSTWRGQRDEGTLAGLAAKRRGRKARADARLLAEIERLRRENQRLTEKLRQAETIIEVQKKLSDVLGIPLPAPESNGSEP
jgi:transposase